MFTELWFPLRATLGLVVGDSNGNNFNDVRHRLTQEMLMLGLGGWEAWDVVWLGCEGGACEDGG